MYSTAFVHNANNSSVSCPWNAALQRKGGGGAYLGYVGYSTI